ncbi:MAG: DoxX family protein [Pseudomonadota bacterium]
MGSVKTYGLIGLKALLTAAFGFAAFGKLSGNADMVAVFETIGWGQWFRYVAGIVELGSVILFWIPGLQWIGAGLLVCTMACAILFHILVLGPSFVPALVLGLLCAVVLYAHRPGQVTRA